MERTVYIPNKSFHDFQPAEKFGRLVFLTEGSIRNKLNVNHLYRVIGEGMADAREGDLLLVSGMGLLNAIAASIFAAKFGRVNFLIHSQDPGNTGSGTYSIREIVLPWGRASNQEKETDNETDPDV